MRASGDAGVSARIERQIDAQIACIIDPRREGRRSTLLVDKHLAIAAAELHDRGGLTARQIGELIGASLPRDVRGDTGSLVRSEQDNVRSALDPCREDPSTAEIELRLAAAMALNWMPSKPVEGRPLGARAGSRARDAKAGSRYSGIAHWSGASWF
jgi:hypothetical protein